MKKLLLVVVLLPLVLASFATTYYSVNNAVPNVTTSWRTNRNGTGSSPSNFNAANDIFIVQAGHTMTTTANWTVGGNNATIIVENAAVLKANHKITIEIFQLYNGGKYTHNDNSSSIPGSDSRLLAANSTIEINDWAGNTELPGNTTWGNLIIDMPGYNSNINQTGDLTDIAGSLTIRSTGNAGKEFRLAGSQDYDLTIGGDLIIEGGILEASSGNNDAQQYITVNGSFIQTGGTFARSNSNITPLVISFNGANSYFTKSAGTLSSGNINWKVNSGKKLTLNNDLPVGLLRSLTVAGTLDMGNKAISGSGSFIVNTGGALINANTGGLPGTLGLLTGLLTFNSGVSYTFLSATTTPFPTLLVTVAAANVTVGANVTFNKNVTVSGTFTLNNGKATIAAGNTITVTSGNAIAGSGFDATKHIVTQVNTVTGAKGFFRIQNFTGSRTIPVGNGTYYLPVTLITTGTNDFSICVFNGVTANGEPNGTAYTTTQKKDWVDAVWQVNRNAGTTAVTMQMAWPAALEGSGFQNIYNGEIGIKHYGTGWETAIGSGNQALNTALRSSILSFSPFAVAKGPIPLPLKFGDIKAVYKNNNVQIDWSSLTEMNLEHYEIEKSTDAHNFISIGQVTGSINSDSRHDYTWRDPIGNDGIFFYRIKAVDVDGKYSYSTIVKVNVSQLSPSVIAIYPNPVIGSKVTIQTGYLKAGSYRITIYDQAGRIVQQQTMQHTGGAITQQVSLTPSLLPGIYTLLVNDNGDLKMIKPFMVQ